MFFCDCKPYEDCDCEIFDINASQAKFDEEVEFWLEIENKQEKILADDWGDKWDHMYSSDRFVTQSLR